MNLKRKEMGASAAAHLATGHFDAGAAVAKFPRYESELCLQGKRLGFFFLLLLFLFFSSKLTGMLNPLPVCTGEETAHH